MQNITNFSKKLVIFPIILITFLWVSHPGAADLPLKPIDEPKTNVPAGDASIFLPLVMSGFDSCVGEWESPFSIEISALHQITSTLTGQSLTSPDYPYMNKEEYYAWYNEAFPTLLDALKDSGAGWTRINLSWAEIEPNAPVEGQPPSYSAFWLDWYDDRLLQIAQTGIKMSVTINWPPAWANNDQICPQVTSDHQDEYQRFLTDIVTRYSSPPFNVDTWEIFNEADNTTPERSISHACFGDFALDYAQILAQSYPTIKSINPYATVLMSGIAHDWFTYNNGPFNRKFPEGVIDGGGASYFDALNFHYFPAFADEWERWNPPGDPPTCGDIENGLPFPPGEKPYDGSGIDVIAKKNHLTNRLSVCKGVIKPVWLTETSESAIPPKTLADQAHYVVQVYTRGLAAGIQNITWYALAIPNDPFGQGLLDNDDFSPSPAFFSYKNMVKQLTGYRYIRSLSVPGGEAYVFNNKCQQEKTVAWGNNTTLTFSPANTLQVVDYLGAASFIQDGGIGDVDWTLNGSILIMLTENPIYIYK